MVRTVSIPGFKTDAQKRANHSQDHTALQKAIAQYLSAVGAWHVGLCGGIYQRPGLPDKCAFILHPVYKIPVSVWIECKTGTGRLTPYQREVRDEIINHGGVYILARSVDDVHKRLKAEGLVTVDLLEAR